MAYYDILISAWNSSIQPPTGVTGTGLSSTQTTTQKLSNVNGWTVTGSIPTSFVTTGSALANCINFAEFNTLTAAQQSNLLGLLQISGGLLGGSTNVGLLTAGMFVTYFTTPSSPTIANLTALAKATTQSWAQANGYPYASSVTGNLGGGDLSNAGGLN